MGLKKDLRSFRDLAHSVDDVLKSSSNLAVIKAANSLHNPKAREIAVGLSGTVGDHLHKTLRRQLLRNGLKQAGQTRAIGLKVRILEKYLDHQNKKLSNKNNIKA